MKRAWIVCILIVLVLLALPCWAAPAAPVGTVSALEGRADITRNGEPAVTARQDDNIFIGDIVSTGITSRLEITFLDASVTRLAAGTRLKVTAYLFDAGEREGTLDLFRGKVQSLVADTTPDSAFEIHTPTAVVGVRGTRFFTYFADDIMGAATLEGTVYVFSRNLPDEVRVMGPGMAVVVASADDIPDVRPATDQELQQHIDDTTISQASSTAFFTTVDEAETVASSLDQRIRDLREHDIQQRHVDMITRLQHEDSEAETGVDGRSSSVEYHQVMTAERLQQQLTRQLQSVEAERERLVSESRGCFPAETLVKMEGGSYKPLAEVRPGERVITYDIGYERRESKPVVGVYTLKANHLYTINGTLKTTGGERLLSQDGWKTVRNLKTGDMVHIDGRMEEIRSIEFSRTNLRVHNMQVDDTHNFYVVTTDGSHYLVHNSSGGGGNGGGGNGGGGK